MESDLAKAIRELKEATKYLASKERELKVAHDEYEKARSAFHRAVLEEANGEG